MTSRLFTRRNVQAGFALPLTLAVILAVTIIMGAVSQLIYSNITLVSNNIKSQKALNIAEAGINYYLWHLSHNGTDYRDGQTTPATPDPQLGYGPYVHNYVDDNAEIAGTYTLWIKPQSTGSTLMTVRSIGKANGYNATRTVVAQIGAPSFASYGVVSDGALWFGNTESANGPVHSNVGVRMDGPSNSDVSSANATYTPSGSVGGDGNSHPGVWCNTGVLTPVNCNTRSKIDWLYPVSSIDFNQVSTSLCTMKKAAFSSDAATSALANLANACTQVPTTRTAAYLPRRASSFSQSVGYLIQLNPNNTYDLFNVNSENDQLTPYTSALGRTSVATGIAIPSNGVIFAEDNVWIRTNPTFNGRVSIGAGRLASTTQQAYAIFADDVVYSSKDGSVAIGVVAENDVMIAPYAPPATGSFNFEINAAVISQTSDVMYPLYYRTNSTRCTRGWTSPNQTFTFYGSVAVRQTWTWIWSLGGGSCGDAAFAAGTGYITGILNNSTNYDYNLLYAPPPSYPVTSTYNILSWREYLTKP